MGQIYSNREKQKCKQMLDVAAYKAAINKFSETVYEDSPADDIASEFDVLYSQQKLIEMEFNRIKSVIRKNTIFEKDITSFRLRVKTPTVDEIPVKDTLVGYGDTADLLVAKQRIMEEQLATIDRKIASRKRRLSKDETLYSVKSGIEEFDADIEKMILIQ